MEIPANHVRLWMKTQYRTLAFCVFKLVLVMQQRLLGHAVLGPLFSHTAICCKDHYHWDTE